MKSKDVVIIGAGPAGISAAVQLKRYDIEAVLLEKDEAGGLLREANIVENYPGFPEGISGMHLADLFTQQLDKSGIEINFEKVLKLDYKKELFLIKTDNRIYSSRIVIIASGTMPRAACIEIPAGLNNHVFFGIRQLYQVKNKKIAIIGAGDIAFDYALNLSKNNEVFILNRGNLIKCLPLLYRRVKETENISYLENVTVKNIKSHSDGLILNLNNSKIKNEYDIFASCILYAIGRVPCDNFISENVNNNIDKLEDMKILHMIGDFKKGYYRQTAIAAGDGIKCAMKISEKLRRRTQ